MSTVRAVTNTLTRLLDSFNQPAGILLDSGYALFYARDTENRVCAVSNAGFTAQYTYTGGYVSGCTLALPGGGVLARAVSRDPHRPWLVTGVTNLFDGAVISAFAYT